MTWTPYREKNVVIYSPLALKFQNFLEYKVYSKIAHKVIFFVFLFIVIYYGVEYPNLFQIIYNIFNVIEFSRKSKIFCKN